MPFASGRSTTASPGVKKRRWRKRTVPLYVLAWAGPFMVLLAVKSFVLGVFVVSGESMEDTLYDGQRVLVQQVGQDYQRGDIVVFDGAGSWEADRTLGSPARRAWEAVRQAVGADRDPMYIKRVIGVPGDTVACCGPQGQVLGDLGEPGGPEGLAPLEEPYVFEDDHRPFEAVTVPVGYLWVMGDHRSQSADSRSFRDGPTGGLVPIESVSGKVAAVVWPVEQAHRVH